MEGGVLVEIVRRAARRVVENRADRLGEARARRAVGRTARRAGPQATPSRRESGTARRCRAPTGAAPPRRDWAACSISPSAASRRNASRTGPRLTEKRAVRSHSTSRSPGVSRPRQDVLAQLLDDMGDGRASAAGRASAWSDVRLSIGRRRIVAARSHQDAKPYAAKTRPAFDTRDALWYCPTI